MTGGSQAEPVGGWVGMVWCQGVWPVAPRDMYMHIHWRIHSDGSLVVILLLSEPLGQHPAEPVSQSTSHHAELTDSGRGHTLLM